MSDTPFGPVLARLTAAARAPRLNNMAPWVAALAGSGAFVGDLGCGDGTLLSGLRSFGIMGAGVDPSPQMCALARARGVSVQTAALGRAMLPPASLICAIGEALALHPDADTRPPALPALLPRLIQGLKPGGAILLELPGQGVPTGTFWEESESHALHLQATRDGNALIRRHVAFAVDADDASWQRGVELHRLSLFHPAQVTAVLTNVGLTVEPLSQLGDAPLLPGCFALLGRKP